MLSFIHFLLQHLLSRDLKAANVLGTLWKVLCNISGRVFPQMIFILDGEGEEGKQKYPQLNLQYI